VGGERESGWLASRGKEVSISLRRAMRRQPVERSAEHVPPPGSEQKAVEASVPSALPARFARNVTMNYLALGTTALAALALTPLLIHHLGQKVFGIWVLANTTVAYLELFEIGFGGATTKLVAEDASIRPEQALRTINTTFFVLLPLGLIALVVGLGVAPFFPDFVHVVPHLHNQAIIVVAVLAVGLAISIPGDTFGGALVGHQRFDLLALANSLMVIVTTGVSIAIVVTGGGIVSLAVATTLIAVGFQGVRFLMVRRILPGTRLNPRLVQRARRREATRLSAWFFLYALLNAVYSTSDVLLVGILLGLRPAAIYAVGSKLGSAASQGLDSLAGVFFPHASATERNKEAGSLAAVVIDGTRITMLVGMLTSLVLIILALPMIHAWVGNGYGTAASVLVILAIAMAVSAPARPIASVISGMGRLSILCAITGAEVALNLALSITLVLVIGPVGAAVGTLGGKLLVRLPAFLVVGCRATDLSIGTFTKKAILPHVLPSLASAAVLLVLRGFAMRSIPGLILAALAGIIIYLGVYLAFGATPGDRSRLLMLAAKIVPFSRIGAPASRTDA
jgi:O-antigen/teichoic acid export membrane protein